MSAPSAALGPPQAAPTTVRGALATLPTFLRRNVVTVVVSAVAAGVFGWVVNVWMLAVKFEGNNDVPVGSPVTGQNNTNWAVTFWVLCSMVVFGAVGYARAAGMRRFLYDLRTTPRVLIGLVRRDGVRSRVHLLWGAGLALLVGLAVPPAVGAVVSIGVLAALPTVIGAIAGSMLGRMSSAVLKPFRPGAPPLGMESMIVGLTGAGVALFLGFVVPHAGARGALAGGCILLAVVMSQQLKAGVNGAAVTAALVAFVGVAVWVARRLFMARHALADDGGFAECGLDFGTWWRQCDGAGEVRRQGVPGGVASGIGAPIGVFLGSWAGSVARLRPLLFGQDAAPPPADPVALWHQRAESWAAHQQAEVALDDGSTIGCTLTADGPTRPWVTSDLTVAGKGISARLDALAYDAPSPEHAAAAHRVFRDAPDQPLPDLLDRIVQVERQHHDVWRDRLETAQRDLYEQAQTRTGATLDAGQGLAPSTPVATASSERVDRFDGLAQPTSDAMSLHRAVATRAGAADVVHQIEMLQLELHRWGDVHAPLDGHHVTVAGAQHGLVPLAGADLAAAQAARPFTGEHGAMLGDARRFLPLSPGAQVVHLPDASAVVTDRALGPTPDLAGRGLEARHTVAATDHVDRVGAAIRPSTDATMSDLQRLQAELHRHRAVHGVPLEGPEPWYAAQLDALGTQVHAQTTRQWHAELEAVQHQLHTMAAMRHEGAAMDRLVEMRQVLETVAYGRLSVEEGNAESVARFGTGLAGLATRMEAPTDG